MGESLVIDELHKTYQGGNTALDGVSFAAPAGAFVVLLGPSGSGKSTLIRSIAGIERITQGRISIGDRVVADGRRKHLPPEKRGLAMVFQDYALWPHLPAVDNVAFTLRRSRLAAAERRRRAREMLERVGLGGLAERFPNELSGGEQQRVALARALVGGDGLVLFDEPLSNLDADLRDRIRVEIATLVRSAGATTVYITHDQSEAFALADQIGVLDKGRLVQMGTPEQIYERPLTPFVTRFTGVAVELQVMLCGGRDAGGRVEVELAGPFPSRLRARLGGPEPRQDGGTALLLVRPAAVSLCAAGDQSAHAVGVVADVAFRGRGYELAIDLPGRTRVSGVGVERRVGRGEGVGLRFAATGCVAFAEGETEARQGTAADDPVMVLASS